MRYFNTAGPVNRENHYKLDPMTRWDKNEVLSLIDQEKYFLLHAPRQTGKTSCLLALRDYLNKREKYTCVYVNFEAGQVARNDVPRAMTALLDELDSRLDDFKVKIPFSAKSVLETTGCDKALGAYFKKLASFLSKPLVLLIDEIDALVGDSLISVLRQIRAGYDTRPENFPLSVILCGVRDIKDYRIHRNDGEVITGGSCFNIKAESLTLGNFSECEIHELYDEHTKETGQRFAEDVFPMIFRLTGGQPWLVNALAYEACFKMEENLDRSVEITVEKIENAKERLILSRSTHLDQLSDKLKEERVRRIIEPMLLGELSQAQDDDVDYCMDLGLVVRGERGIVIANEIYREVMPRELSKKRQDDFSTIFAPEWVDEDNSLNTEKLLSLFQLFWLENSEIWSEEIAGYHEAAPHLVFMGFLQRVANGSGRVDREYALGRKRVDLMLKWHSTAGEQRVVVELKMLKERDTYDKLKETALKQTA